MKVIVKQNIFNEMKVSDEQNINNEMQKTNKNQTKKINPNANN